MIERERGERERKLWGQLVVATMNLNGPWKAKKK